MEDQRRRRERFPKRCYQCSRLEDELWESAYERLWPVVREMLKTRLEDAKQAQEVNHLTTAKGA